jgi:hypothetical protein
VVALQTGRRSAYLAYVAISVLAVYTILLSALVVAAHALSLVLRRRKEIPWRPLTLSGAAICVLCVPVGVAAAIRGTAPVEWVAGPGSFFGANMRSLVAFLASARSDGVLAAWVLAGVLFLYAMARRGLAGGEAWAYGLLIAWFLLPIVIEYLVSELVHPVIGDRYLLDVLPPASMLAGVACSRLRPLSVALAAAAAVLVLRAWVLVPSYGETLENWRAAVTAVVDDSRPHDCVAFFVADGYMPFDYYVLRLVGAHPPPPTPVLPDSSWAARSPHVLEPAVIPAARMPAAVASCPRLWLVLTHNLGFPPGPGVIPYRVSVYEEQLALRSEIDAYYAAGRSMKFLGSTITLYERRAGAAGAGP